MKIGYFPGCTLQRSSKEYANSVQAVANKLGVQLVEIQDWTCCGATSAHVTNRLLALSLPARNLALAEAQGLDQILVPCAACYSRLASTRQELGEDHALAKRIATIIDRPLALKVRVISILTFLAQQSGHITRKVTIPLHALKVACYYGCLLVRPPRVAESDDPEMPTSMETIVKAAGAGTVRWNRGLDCCGGGFALSRTGSVVRLGRSIVEDALHAGANALVVGCPMCQTNLDLRQKAMAKSAPSPLVGNPLPVLFLSQLVGLAMGVAPKLLGLHHHFVDTWPLLETLAAPPHALSSKNIGDNHHSQTPASTPVSAPTSGSRQGPRGQEEEA